MSLSLKIICTKLIGLRLTDIYKMQFKSKNYLLPGTCHDICALFFTGFCCSINNLAHGKNTLSFRMDMKSASALFNRFVCLLNIACRHVLQIVMSHFLLFVQFFNHFLLYVLSLQLDFAATVAALIGIPFPFGRCFLQHANFTIGLTFLDHVKFMLD